MEKQSENQQDIYEQQNQQNNNELIADDEAQEKRKQFVQLLGTIYTDSMFSVLFDRNGYRGRYTRLQAMDARERWEEAKRKAHESGITGAEIEAASRDYIADEAARAEAALHQQYSDEDLGAVSADLRRDWENAERGSKAESDLKWALDDLREKRLAIKRKQQYDQLQQSLQEPQPQSKPNTGHKKQSQPPRPRMPAPEPWQSEEKFLRTRVDPFKDRKR